MSEIVGLICLVLGSMCLGAAIAMRDSNGRCDKGHKLTCGWCHIDDAVGVTVSDIFTGMSREKVIPVPEFEFTLEADDAPA